MFRSFFFIACVFAAAPAHANGGVLLFSAAPWWMAVLLVSVIGIETTIVKRYLKSVSWKKVMGVTCWANIVSTFVGVPIMFLLLRGMQQALSMGARHLSLTGIWKNIPRVLYHPQVIYHGEEAFMWVWPTFVAIAFVTFFLTSAWSERLVTSRMLPMVAKEDVRKAVWRANSASYIFLAVMVVGMPYVCQGSSRESVYTFWLAINGLVSPIRYLFRLF